METDPLVTGTGATQAGSTGSTQTTSSSSSSDEDMSIFENYEEIYESSDWEEIEPEKGGFFNSSYTYTLPDGTTIKLDDIEDVIVKVNKNTGEIILVGAENAVIDGGDSDVKIKIFDSTLDKLTTGSGDDNIYLYNTEVSGNIITKNGDDSIRAYEGSVINDIFMDNGNDYLYINDSIVTGKIDTSGGDDRITIGGNSQINKIDSGTGNDEINLNNSTVTGDIDGDSGNDKITIYNSKVEGTISGGNDSDTIEIKNNSSVNNIKGGKGDDIINIFDSSVTGKLHGNYDDDTIYAVNSSLNEVYGGNDDDTFTFENTTIDGEIATGASHIFDWFNGNDTVNIIGSETGDIDTGNGDDDVNISDSETDNVDTGKGDDNVNIDDSETGDVDTGNGDDTVTVDNSETGDIDTGKGDDIIDIDDSETGNIDGGKGDDSIDIDNSETGTVDGGEGNDNIYYDEDSDIEDIVEDEKDNITEIQDIPELVNVPEMSDSVITASQGITNDIASKYTDKVLTEEEQYYVLLIDTFAQNLENIKSQFNAQENEDGVIRDAYNWVKQLTDLGISKEDIKAAIDEQEQMINEMIAALNNEGNTSFEDVYKKWTGKEYNQENISEYLESAQLYSLALNGLSKISTFQSQISSASSLGKVLELFESFYGKENGKAKLNKLLQDGFLNNPEVFGWVKSVEINENNELVVTRPDESTTFGPIEGTTYTTTVDDIFTVTNMIQTMPMGFDLDVFAREFSDDFAEEMGFSIERLQAKHIADQEKAFGNNTAFQKLIDKYCADQDGFAEKLASVAQIGGIAMMAAGGILTFVCPPAGTALMSAGKWTAVAGMFSDNAIELVDNLASENGLTSDEAWDLMKKTITEIALLYSGAKINGVANKTNAIVLNATQNKTLSFLAEIGTDASLSLLTDLMITGEVNLSGEGLSQLLGIITGIAGAKVNTYNKEAFDSADALFKQGNIDEAYDYLISKGFSEKQIYNKFSQAEIDRITQYYESSGDYDAALEMLNNSKILSYSDNSKRELLNALKNVEYEKIYDMYEAKSSANPGAQDSIINEIKDYISEKDFLSQTDANDILENIEVKSVINKIYYEYGINLNKYKEMDFSSSQGKIVAQDIDLIYKAASLGVSVNDLMVPSVKNISEGLLKVQAGDVFEVEGSDNIYFKTVNGDYKELNISKDAYCRLFPAVDRYASGQQSSGDCYLVSALNTMMSNPETREILLSCFTENADGNISVKMPTSGLEIVIKPGQKIEDLGVDPNNAVTGALGIQLLEYLYKVDCTNNYINNNMDTITRAEEDINNFNSYILNIYNSNKEYYNKVDISDEKINNNPEALYWYLDGIYEGLKKDLNDKYRLLIMGEDKLPFFFESINFNVLFNSDGSLNNDGIRQFRSILTDVRGRTLDEKALNEIVTAYKTKYGEIAEDIIEIRNINIYDIDQAKDILAHYNLNNYEFIAGRGGWSDFVFSAFGLNNVKKYSTTYEIDAFLDKIIANPKMQDNYVITAATILTKEKLRQIYKNSSEKYHQYLNDNPQIYKQLLDAAPENLPYGLVSSHAYSFEVTTNEAGETVIKVTNPWDISSSIDNKVITLTVEEFKQYFSDMSIAEIP